MAIAILFKIRLIEVAIPDCPFLIKSFCSCRSIAVDKILFVHRQSI